MGEKQRLGGIALALVGYCCGSCHFVRQPPQVKVESGLSLVFSACLRCLGNFTEVRSFIPSPNLSRRE